MISLTPEVDLICNDEGKLMHLPVNRALLYDTDEGEKIYDFVAGSCLCLRHKDGEFTSILEEDIANIQRYTKPIEAIFPPNLILMKEDAECVEWKEDANGNTD